MTSPAPAPTSRPWSRTGARRLLGACAAAVLLALTLAPAAHAATDGEQAGDAATSSAVTWGVRTASLDLGADRQNYAYAVEPGEEVLDAIVVTNHDDEPLELDLYAADGFTSDAGELDVLTRDAASTGLGAWVRFATDHVRLEPAQSLQVDFAITVPADAEPGDHAGAVVTSLADAGADGVTVDRRLGIRMHLRVAGDLRPVMTVEDLRVDHQPSLNPLGQDSATVSYTVRNDGNVRLSADQAVSVTGPFGTGRVRAAGLAPVPELLPGESWDVTTTLDVLPLVRLAATVTLDPQLPEEIDGVPAPGQVRGSGGAWAVPWSVLVLLLAAVGTVLLARRRAARRRLAEQTRVEQAVAQALRDRDDAPVRAGA